MKHFDFMKVAIDEAFEGMKKRDGGPFGAVVVKDGVIIASGHNEVRKNNDPTAHAEVTAIRKAGEKLGTFDLSGCTIYSTCEPCPMCFGAISWSNIKNLYFGCTREDAAKLGFDDKHMYDVLKGTEVNKKFTSENIHRMACLETFRNWKIIKQRNTTEIAKENILEKAI